MILTIVIPIYNVELYISKCLLSCINQTGTLINDYEIVLVNDGTKDDSMGVVNKILDSNRVSVPIKVVTQNNMGLSEARNTGLRHATGEYVWFVDSDDWIDEDSVRSIITALKNGDVDILQMPFKFVYENNSPTKIEQIIEISSPISGYESMKITRFPNLTQSRIHRRQFLINNNLKFIPGILHEDAEFKPRVIWKAESIKTLNKPCYNYLKREKDSITASFTLRNAEGRWYGIKSMSEFSKDFSFRDKLLFNKDINFNMVWILATLKVINKDDRLKIITAISKSKKIFKRMLFSKSPKKVIVYSALYAFPRLFLNFYLRFSKVY